MPRLLDRTETVGIEKEMGGRICPPRLEHPRADSERGGDGDAGGDEMTKHELLVMSAYTSYLFCEADELHKFIEETLGRPVLTHELSENAIWVELRGKLKPEINKIIKEAQP